MNEITVKNIEKHFGRNGLSNTSFGLKQGDYLCITGGSGCGKTTLLNIISGMLKADKGEVILNGKDIYSSMDERSRTKLRNKKIGYMMQGNTLIPELDIISNIRCPLELNGIKVKKERILEIAVYSEWRDSEAHPRFDGLYGVVDGVNESFHVIAAPVSLLPILKSLVSSIFTE